MLNGVRKISAMHIPSPCSVPKIKGQCGEEKIRCTRISRNIRLGIWPNHLTLHTTQLLHKNFTPSPSVSEVKSGVRFCAHIMSLHAVFRCCCRIAHIRRNTAKPKMRCKGKSFF